MKRLLYIILIAFLLLDTAYSFYQHYKMPLDGDLAMNVLRAGDLAPTFSDPFGFRAFVHHEKYFNPNRFFSQYANSEYFLTTPFLLQHFVNPIDSVYLACAILKTVLQVLLIYLLCVMITGSYRVFNKDFLIAAVLITPLFQTEGYNPYMGIIDQSISYVFFYALPLVFLLLYFQPLYRFAMFDKPFRLSWISGLLLFCLALMVSFSGPLNTGIVLITALILLGASWYRHYNLFKDSSSASRIKTAAAALPKTYLYLLIPLSLISLYSLYIGTFNVSNYNNIPLAEAYSRIPAGLYLHFTPKLGFPLLCLIIAINAVFIKKWHYDNEGKKIFGFLMFMIVFSVIYIALLPLGGYRPYRPNILRYDTAIPITVGFFIVYGISTLFVLRRIGRKYKPWYILAVVAFLVLLTINDNSSFNANDCEKAALQKIAACKADVVELDSGCRVMAWDTISKPGESVFNAELLNYWGVTKKKTLYFQTGNKTFN
ncbi:MAG: hypothetical protein NTU51_02170 [Bacteroidetes bacterium]|nr:hypothetical protein [Bacteroidota bacterium]